MAATNSVATKKKFGAIALLLQAIFVLVFAIFARYEDDGDDGDSEAAFNDLVGVFSMFRDTHSLVFVGFGFLMAYLKFYGIRGVSLNLFICALVVQWSLIVNGFFRMRNGTFLVGIKSLVSADFACISVAVSFGALLGRISPLQCIVLALVEVPIFAANHFVGLHKFQASDAGCSIFVHAFGAYFGMAAARTLAKAEHVIKHRFEKSSPTNELFAAVGALFLWLHWPSLNSVMVEESDAKRRAVFNTCLALVTSAVASAATWSLVEDNDDTGQMRRVFNAGVAGGVAVGTVASWRIQVWAAAGIGCLAGLTSVLSCRVVAPRLRQNRFLDTAGVHNVHGIPGLLAAIFGVIFSALASFENYGHGLYKIFPARAGPTFNLTRLSDVTGPDAAEVGEGRSALLQAAFQAAACSATLLCASVGGMLTGQLMLLRVFDSPSENELYTSSVTRRGNSDPASVTREFGLDGEMENDAEEAPAASEQMELLPTRPAATVTLPDTLL